MLFVAEPSVSSPFSSNQGEEKGGKWQKDGSKPRSIEMLLVEPFLLCITAVTAVSAEISYSLILAIISIFQFNHHTLKHTHIHQHAHRHFDELKPWKSRDPSCDVQLETSQLVDKLLDSQSKGFPR